MRSIYRLFALAACTGALGGCAGMELESARGLGAGGSSFGQALFDKYIALSESEYREGDYPDSDKFALRARSLAGGRMVEPEPIGNRNLTGAAVGELTSARAKLVEVFAGGARDRKPMEAAQAQAMFDCWMQEQEENRQPGHIARCRSGFAEALFALAPPPAKAAAKTVTKPSGGGWPKNYVVFFAHDSSRLDATAQNRINQAAKKVAETGPRSVVVSGYADRSGGREYNLKLSWRRAEAVAAALIDAAVNSDLIERKAYGEDKPRVPTPDDERNGLNRAAEITLYRK